MRQIQIAILLFLGAVIGAQVLSGAVVAPTIFRANGLLGGDFLTRAQSGVLMTNVFVKLAWAGFIAAILGVAFEAAWALGRGFCAKCAVFGAAWLVLAAVFLFYYVGYIQGAMQAAQTTSEAFAATHRGSERLFGAMVVVELIYFVLFALRLTKNS